MEIKGFKKLTIEEKENTYGGWAWLAALVPLLIQSLVGAVGAFKAISSDDGSIKGTGIDAHWKTHTNKDANQNKVVYFAY